MARMETTLPGRVVDVTARSGVEPTHFVVARDTGVTRRSVTRHRVTATLDALPGALVAWTTRRRPRLAAGDVVEVTLDPSITPPLITGLAAPGASRWRTLDLRAHGEWLTGAPDAATLAGLGITTGAAARADTGTGTGTGTHAGRAGRVLAVGLVTAALLLITGLIVWARPDAPTAQAGPHDQTEPAVATSRPTTTGPARTGHHQSGNQSGNQSGRHPHLITTPPPTAPTGSLPTTLPTDTQSMPTSYPLPDVTRLSVTAATRILTTAGFRVDVPDGALGTQRVTRTNPAPGALLETGALVHVFVATTAEPSSSSPPTPTLDPTVTTAPSAAPSTP